MFVAMHKLAQPQMMLGVAVASDDHMHPPVCCWLLLVEKVLALAENRGAIEEITQERHMVTPRA